MRRLRQAARAGAILGLAVVLAPAQGLALLAKSRLAGRIPVLFHRAALRIIGLRVTVRGRPARRPLLVVANHASWLDVSVIGSLLPASFVARADMRGWPGVNVLARLQRTIFVDRERRHATGSASDVIAGRLAAGDAVVLFAEGTTSDGNRILPYRSALLGAVRGRDAVIQPVCLAWRGRSGLPLGRAERPAVAWYGDMTLGPHLLAALAAGPIDVEVVWGEPVRSGPDGDRKALARTLEAWTRRRLAEALTGRAVPPGL